MQCCIKKVDQDNRYVCEINPPKESFATVLNKFCSSCNTHWEGAEGNEKTYHVSQHVVW